MSISAIGKYLQRSAEERYGWGDRKDSRACGCCSGVMPNSVKDQLDAYAGMDSADRHGGCWFMAEQGSSGEGNRID